MSFRHSSMLTTASFALLLMVSSVSAQGSVDTMVKMIDSGRITEQRLPQVLDMICKRANDENLAFVFQMAVKPDGFPAAVRPDALKALHDAAISRNAIPTGDLSAIGELLKSDDRNTQTLAVELAGLWKVEGALDALAKLATEKKTGAKLKKAAVNSLAKIGGPKAVETLEKLTQPSQPLAIRYLGASALVDVDVDNAAKIAGQILTGADTSTDPAVMIDAFLAQQSGPTKLGAVLAETELTPDVAKMCLRQMFAVGRSDPELVSVLSKAAGIDDDAPALTPDEIKAVAAEVLQKGDAQRGEALFRRADLNCFKCHSLSGAGGQIGPDLSAVGGSSPADYVVTSILYPEQAVKEAYTTRTILTIDGKVYTGIVAEEDDDRVIMKQASGQAVVIPVDDIEDEKEGGSLMPKGLAKFLTHDEFLDLSRFISELGKPGEYKIRTDPTVQRWRVLTETPAELAASVPTIGELEELIIQSPEDAWTAAYAMTAGALPLAELTADERPVLYLMAEVEVVVGGKVQVGLNETTGVRVWVGDDLLPEGKPEAVELEPGKHAIYFRVDPAIFPAKTLRATVDRPADSHAEYTVVSGA
ncbi:HEAT repeat domain-containing protein [Blastopirellula marina]|uniref:Probable L-sorbosone dehydrogenase n=1 Tax=Blastopirellula marina DSM 3645 TaxID=314230 RepID=A3ZXP5_9BACT|nr:HEAT repeat domain-containing protein [Blastopirellula marina]EAQ78613.1 probable L-sorbosone dehydrogenase [Blastopirellula marina DSM 3645]